jgi:hypothetical protein
VVAVLLKLGAIAFGELAVYVTMLREEAALAPMARRRPRAYWVCFRRIERVQDRPFEGEEPVCI